MHYKENPYQRKSMEQERLEILVGLCRHDRWDMRLLSDVLFGNVVETVLQPRERFILEMKVDGRSDKYIWHTLNQNAPKGMSFASYQKICSYIKRKLSDGFDINLPGWIKGQCWLNAEEDVNPDKLWEELP
jgi:hypothetical protein